MTCAQAEAAGNRFATISLCGFAFHVTTEGGLIDAVLEDLDEGRGGWIVTANLDHLRRAGRTSDYAELVRAADVVVADGMPLVWASRLQQTPLPERIAGSSLIHTLSRAAAERKRSVFLLGGDPYVAEEAGHVLERSYAGLRIAGAYCPPVGFEHDERELATIRDRLASARPDIVYVALGSPKQEALIAKIRGDLPGAWWLGVGISLSFAAGRIQRAPQWVQRLGLEWIHRLFRDPRRLWRRYLVEGLAFACFLAVDSLRSRWRIGAVPH